MRGRRHHGTAIMPCAVVMTPQQKANLKTVFSGQRRTLHSDWQNVMAAHKALTAAILAGSKDVSSQEAALTVAQQQLMKDKDALAMQVCGQLDSSQLSAASTLFNNLSSLHESTHRQARQYFQEAKAAAGSGAGQ